MGHLKAMVFNDKKSNAYNLATYLVVFEALINLEFSLFQIDQALSKPSLRLMAQP
ncbi:MAG: hypothetical protein AAF821_23755 [Cyanobacteria bacterium P01_D01_bin.156]